MQVGAWAARPGDTEAEPAEAHARDRDVPGLAVQRNGLCRSHLVVVSAEHPTACRCKAGGAHCHGGRCCRGNDDVSGADAGRAGARRASRIRQSGRRARRSARTGCRSSAASANRGEEPRVLLRQRRGDRAFADLERGGYLRVRETCEVAQEHDQTSARRQSSGSPLRAPDRGRSSRTARSSGSSSRLRRTRAEGEPVRDPPHPRCERCLSPQHAAVATARSRTLPVRRRARLPVIRRSARGRSGSRGNGRGKAARAGSLSRERSAGPFL